MSDRTPNLSDLAQTLELRWRLLQLQTVAVDALCVTLGLSLLLVLAQVVFRLGLPLPRLLLIVNGIGLIAALVLAAARRKAPGRFLIEADAAYGLKSLLVSGYEFSTAATRQSERATSVPHGAGTHRDIEAHDRRRASFEQIVIASAEQRSEEIDPATVYPAAPPRRLGVAAALVVALGIVVILHASGWFDRPEPPYAQEALLLEDAGRRLAERAEADDQLSELADEIRRLGEQVHRGQLDPEQARRRIEQLNERVEQQIRNLERTPPLEYNEEAEIPPETEDAIRSALQSGMSQGEVVEFFTKMRSEGNTVPQIVDALEQATPDAEPNANLGMDEEQMQELMDQLNTPRSGDETESGIANELENSQRALQQMGSGLAEITEGDDQEVGTAEESGIGLGTGESSANEPQSPSDDSDGDQGSGQQGGTLEVEDEQTDDFRRPEESSPIFREIQGVVTDNTIMDIIIRELPSEATSRLTEQEREILFERVIEEAVNREETPQQLQRLVRNYFLRLTMASEQGDADEQ